MATAADLITLIQYQLRDAGIQWIEAKILKYLDEGQQAIFGFHPEAAQTSDTAIIESAPAAISATTTVLGITRPFYMALVHFVCWKCLGEDTDDEHNQQLAEWHHRQFMEAMQ
jgi:hypothetical protein